MVSWGRTGPDKKSRTGLAMVWADSSIARQGRMPNNASLATQRRGREGVKSAVYARTQTSINARTTSFCKWAAGTHDGKEKKRRRRRRLSLVSVQEEAGEDDHGTARQEPRIRLAVGEPENIENDKNKATTTTPRAAPASSLVARDDSRPNRFSNATGGPCDTCF